MATASLSEATVTGRLNADGTLELDSVVPLPPGRVRVIVHRHAPLSSDEDTRVILARIWARRRRSGIPSRTKEEIDAQIDELREEVEMGFREVERLHEQVRQPKE